MSAYHSQDWPASPLLNVVINGDALEVARSQPDESVNLIISSPPYWGLRKYLPDESEFKGLEIGSEETLDDYIHSLVTLFREMRRILRKDGCMWLNMGDSYAGGGRGIGKTQLQTSNRGSFVPRQPLPKGIKAKDLVGQPWMLAFALRNDGWYLRLDGIWNKPNPMPGSQKDRPTMAHEYIFLLSKSQHYYFDLVPMQTPVKEHSIKRQGRAISDSHKNSNGAPGQTPHSFSRPRPNLKQNGTGNRQYAGFNERYDGQKIPMASPRSVFTVPTTGFKGSHFATYPIDLIKPLVDAACPPIVCSSCGKPHIRITRKIAVIDEQDTTARMQFKNRYYFPPCQRYSESKRGQTTLGWKPTCTCNVGTKAGVVYDPFMGSGTSAAVATLLGRQFSGSELNPDYMPIIDQRNEQARKDRMEANKQVEIIAPTGKKIILQQLVLV